MSDMATLLVVAALTWLLRINLLVLVPAARLPAGLRAALDHLAPAVLAAMLALQFADSVTATGGGIDWILTLAAAALITAVSYRSGSLAIPAAVALAAVLFIDLVAS
jgi:branched-subunit amino acid transport protein